MHFLELGGGVNIATTTERVRVQVVVFKYNGKIVLHTYVCTLQSFDLHIVKP